MTDITKLIATAKLHAPGGVLNDEDKRGIYRRAERIGMTHCQVDELILSTPAATRAPRINQQWLDK